MCSTTVDLEMAMPKWNLPYCRKSNGLIFTDKLQFKLLQKLKPEKRIQALTGLEPVRPRYRLGATTS